MAIQSSITFYRVVRCGYYRWGEPEPAAATLPETLSALEAWSQAARVGNLCPFPADPAADILRVFCADVVKHEASGDFLLVTFNELIDPTDGTVQYLDPTSRAGDVRVDTHDPPAGRIPGFTTYFWFIPSRHLVATITVVTKRAGLRGMERMIRGFLRSAAPWVRGGSPADPETADDEITAYYDPRTGNDLPGVNPRVNVGLQYRASELQILRERREDIRKVLRREIIQPATRDRDAARWDFFKRDLTHREPTPQRPGQVRIRYELGYTPTEDELNDLIERRTAFDRKKNDVGFRLGSGEERWLSEAVARTSFDLDLTLETGGLLPTPELLDLLEAEKERLLRRVRIDD